MTNREDWCTRFADHPRVVAWLTTNPPPAGWQGTPAEWAYTEMPILSPLELYR